MRNLKRVLSLALALVMVLGMMVITTSAADFTDAEKITYDEAVEVMTQIGILSGRTDGTFDPEGTLIRSEAAKIIAYVAMGTGIEEYLAPTTPYFTDIAENWAAKYINVLVNLKVVDGNGDGTYNPDGKLTVAQFAKMLMLAIGVEGEFTGAEWKGNVKTAFNKIPELVATGLEITDADPEITREEACHMALAAMKVGTEVVEYIVYDDNGTATDYTDDEVMAIYDNARDAALDAQLLGVSYRKNPVKECLLVDLHRVDYTVAADGGVDAYGRGATVYTYDDPNVEDDEWTKIYVSEKAVKTYDAATKADAIAKDLKGYKVATYKVEDTEVKGAWSVTGSVRVDGAGAQAIGVAAGGLSGKTLSEALAALTDDNAVVEIYANNAKVITKIVVVNTLYTTVSKVNKATETTKANIELTGETAKYETEAFAKDDVVVYTKNANGIADVEKLEGFAGTMTKYTSKGVYTIGDADYELSDSALVLASAIVAKQGKEMFYFLDKNGDIVNMTEVPGEEEEEVVITDYAVITAGKVAKTTIPADAMWGGNPTVTYAAQVKAVLSDGTTGTYELPIVKFAEGANKGKYGYTIGETEVVVEGLTYGNASGNTEYATLNLPNTYTYTLDGNEITLAGKLTAFTGNETEDAVVVRKSDAKFTKASTTIAVDGVAKTVIANENTVFVLGVKNDDGVIDSYVVKTGIAALEATEIAKGAARVIIDVTAGKNAQGAADTSKNVNIAAVVFAETTEFKKTGATGTTNAIYVDGDYVVTKNAQGKDVYTYTAVKKDGTTIEVTGAKDLAAGIYTYKTDMTINTTVSTTKYTVGVISGTTVQVNSDYITVNDETTVVTVAEGAAIATGAELFKLDDNSLIFVVKAAK